MPYFAFLKQQFPLAHIADVPVRIEYRWFLVLTFLTWLTAVSINSLVDDGLTSFFLGFATTLVLFGSIFLHEYAHTFVARMEGVSILEIVLYPFGGFPRLKREPDSWRAEFRIALAGPAASFLLAVAFVVLMAIANSLELNILAMLLFILAVWNFLLAVFNLLPGYPLDGGRILRAYLRRQGRDLNEATVLTGRCGQVIAAALVFFGLFIVLVRGEFLTGFWAALIGLFLFDAAREITSEVSAYEKLIVEEVMQLPISVEPETDVRHFVDRILPLYRDTIFPVAENRQLYGVLLLEDVRKIPAENWQTLKIQSVMRPIKPDYFVEANALLKDAKELMRANGIGALGIIDAHGNLVGFMQRGRIKIRN